jgi:hydrogenase maturation protease
MDEPRGLLVLGLGNVLLGDDGAGVEAVGRLRDDYLIPPDVRVVDGGTLGLALLDELVRARAVILVDAVQLDEPPGTVVIVRGAEVEPTVALRLSPHQVGVSDLLTAARFLDRLPQTVVLVGIVPLSIELGIGCSPAVERHLDDLVACVAAECAAQGHPLGPPIQPAAGEAAP